MAVSRRIAHWVLLLALLSANAADAEPSSYVRVTFSGNAVTLDARNATLGEILREWARLGGATVFNSDALDQTRRTLLLTDVAEAEALKVLLRGTAGYVVAGRDAHTRGPSGFGRLFILPSPDSPSTRPALSAANVLPEPGLTESPEISPEQAELETLAASTPPDELQSRRAEARRRRAPATDRTPPGTVDLQTLAAVDAEVAARQAATLLPPDQRPPSVLLEPKDAPTGRIPSGGLGSAAPGAISPSGLAPGMEAPPVTNPNAHSQAPGGRPAPR